MRVLLVEDDRRLAANVKMALEEAGLAVDAVHDGEDGLAAAEAATYDILVVDINLPRLNGLELTRALRRKKIQSPVLMLTAMDSIDDRVRGLEAGGDDYLVKPFALRELLARIRALTRRHVVDRGARLTAGPITLDTAAHTVTVKSADVRLTAKEFSILEHFMLNRDRVLTKAQIIEHAWNLDFEGDDNLVEVYIGRLRRKLEAAGVTDPIETIRGTGYRITVA